MTVSPSLAPPGVREDMSQPEQTPSVQGAREWAQSTGAQLCIPNDATVGIRVWEGVWRGRTPTPDSSFYGLESTSAPS